MVTLGAFTPVNASLAGLKVRKDEKSDRADGASSPPLVLPVVGTVVGAVLLVMTVVDLAGGL